MQTSATIRALRAALGVAVLLSFAGCGSTNDPEAAGYAQERERSQAAQTELRERLRLTQHDR